MSFYQNVFDLIDLRSFSNLWFWIVLAVMWSSASHWVLGVPYDMVQRARRHGGQAEEDLTDMVRVNVSRLLYIAQVSGLWLLGFGCFLLTGLFVLGLFYRVEFAQALFLLGLPMALVSLLSLSTARLIYDEEPMGEALCARLARHRLYVQMIGIVSIFVTSLWGMYQNLSVSPLSG
ncbi:component of SufBCD complex [uncultured Roseobacter sp.]|uniref:component of SufBCD complex n=1 Tax=uncultured Roseobacter sp. TaxID=114847 RepID=UPI0026168FEF|nr:component of SufBCD complex [uncultured Roseobacter sp.]